MTFLLVHPPVGADTRVCPNICGLYSENTRNTEKHEYIHGSFAAHSCPFALNENHEKEQRHHHSVPPLSGLFGQASSLSLRADTGVCPYTLLPRLFKSPSFFGQTRGLFFGQTRESAPTRAPKAIQTPLPSGGVGGGLFPSGGVGGGFFPLGQEGVGFQVILAEVLASCGQLMVHQRGQLLLQQEEQPFAWLVAVGVHVVFS